MPTYILSKIERTGSGQKVADLTAVEKPPTELAALAEDDQIPVTDTGSFGAWKYLKPSVLLTWLDSRIAATWGKMTGKPSTFPPSAHTHSADEIDSGVLSQARLGSGTADSTKVLGGNQSWIDPFLNLQPVLSASGRDHGIIVSWAILQWTGGSAIVEHQVQWKSGNQGFSSSRQETPSSAPHTIGSLTNGTEHALRFRARNGNGWCPWSSEVTATPSGGEIEFTADGTSVWPWKTASGRLFIYGIFRDGSEWRDTGSDIALGSGNWYGGASDGTTLWFTDWQYSWARAYVAATGARDANKDIDLDIRSQQGGLSDGTTLWFVNDTNDRAYAYVAATQARDASKDIVLESGRQEGGASDGTTLWFLNESSDRARAYVAATRARDANKDILLGTGSWQGGLSNGTTLWFVSGGSGVYVARAYVAATQARDEVSDIVFTSLMRGGASDGTTLWFLDDSTNDARAYRVRPPLSVSIGGTVYVTSDSKEELSGLAVGDDLIVTELLNGESVLIVPIY